MMKRILISILLGVVASNSLWAAEVKPDPDFHCSACDDWNKSVPPFRIHGTSFYVGMSGLSAVLIASKEGLILLDGDLPQSAKPIAENIRSLGYRVEDIKFIVNSHAHYDHVGGIAALQRASGAIVAVSPASAQALRAGTVQPDDPQYGFRTQFPAVKNIKEIADGEVLRVGELAITAHFTPGHTPGGTTWTWQSCEQSECVNIVYADSVNAVSPDDYRFIDHPEIVKALRQSISIIEHLPCDIIIPVHPELADIHGKRARMPIGSKENPLIDSRSCEKYAAASAKRLENRLAEESGKK